MSSTDLSPGSHTLDRIESLESGENADSGSEEGDQLRYLTNAELREEILHMAGIDFSSSFYCEERNASKEFNKAQRIGIVMHLVGSYMDDSNPMGEFCEQAIEYRLERRNIVQLNQRIGELTGIDVSIDEDILETNPTTRLNRDQLKQLYRFLEEMN